jgi:hypothetical protein
MTASRDDAEFTDIDTYIIRQLHDAAATLTACTDMHARLHEVFRAVTPSGEPDNTMGIPRGE